MTPFRGVSAFPVTPQDGAGRVDADALRRVLGRLRGRALGSIGLLGSTGSAVYLSRAERRRTVEVAVDALAGTMPLLIGIGALRTDEAIALGQDARAIGADAVLLAPVSYVPLREEEVEEHCAAVAHAVDLPLCLYNNPATTRFTFDAPLVARLSRIANIRAIKNPSGGAGATADAIARSRVAAAPGFSFGWSVDAHAAEAMIAGGDAWYSVVAGFLPDPCVAIAAAAARGDHAAARALDVALRPLTDLLAEWSGYRVAHEAARLLGLSSHHPPRPVLPLPADGRARLAAVLGELGSFDGDQR